MIAKPPREGLVLWLDANRVYDPAGNAHVAENGQVERWHDLSGNGKHAGQSDVNKRPIYVKDIQGRWGTQFDAVNDVLDCGTSSDLRPDAWTIEAWVKLTNDADGYCSLLSWVGGSANPLVRLSGATTFQPLVFMGDSNFRYFPSSAWTTIKNGEWHHVIFSLPGSAQGSIGDCTMHLDGAAVSATNTVSTGLQTAKVGCFIGGGASPSLGRTIGRLCMYNRVLSTTERDYLYNLGPWRR